MVTGESTVVVAQYVRWVSSGAANWLHIVVCGVFSGTELVKVEVRVELKPH